MSAASAPSRPPKPPPYNANYVSNGTDDDPPVVPPRRRNSPIAIGGVAGLADPATGRPPVRPVSRAVLEMDRSPPTVINRASLAQPEDGTDITPTGSPADRGAKAPGTADKENVPIQPKAILVRMQFVRFCFVFLHVLLFCIDNNGIAKADLFSSALSTFMGIVSG